MRRLLGLLVLLGAVGAHAEDLSFVGGTDKNPATVGCWGTRTCG